MKRLQFVAGALLLLSSTALAAEADLTREQDAQCFTAIAHEAERSLAGSSTDNLTRDLLRAEPYYGGKIRARFSDAELSAALRTADQAMANNPKRREFAITCWQMFQIDMMVVTQSASASKQR